MIVAVSDEHALFGAKSEFMCVVWSKERPASTTERFKEIIIWFGFVSKETFKRCGIVNDSCRHSVNEMNSCGKGLVPKF
jgi:hypothetical protein